MIGDGLSAPEMLTTRLREARDVMGRAHMVAGEQEGGRFNLNGPWRDMTFAIGSAIEALVELVELAYPPETADGE